MLREFRKKTSYIVTYELQQLTVMVVAIVLMFLWNPWNIGSRSLLLLLCVPLIFSGPVGYVLSAAGIAYFYAPAQGFDGSIIATLSICGIVFGFIHSQLVHFCSHYLLRPRWLNRILGEILSLQFFGTFLGFTVLHLEHHAYADDLALDPHPNQGEGFFNFFMRLTRTMATGFKTIYFKAHKNAPDRELQWQRYWRLVPTRCYTRVLLLILVLGPTGFLFFHLPSMMANHWVFGHLNYYSHLRRPDGTVEIQNLNQKFFHRVLNLLTLGAYNHGNHHRAPNFLFPPKKRDELL